MFALLMAFALAGALPEKGSAPPGYVLTRTSGAVFYVKSFEKKGFFHVITDFGGKVTQQNADLVRSIEPMTAGQASDDAPSPPESGGFHAARGPHRRPDRGPD